MKIPVILLNYNSSADCRKCVGFLQRQEGVELEIVVVDNCSRPDDRQAVETLCREQRLTYIPASENRGYNAGNNIGLRYAAAQGYKYALIANPDMEFPQTDYVDRLAAVMVEQPEVAACGSDIVTPEGIHQNPMARDGDWRSSFGWIRGVIHRNRQKEAYDFIDHYEESHYCAKLSGCCLMVRMDIMSSLGFFDDGVFLYCEEAILSRQVEQAGKRMYYLSDTQAVHAHVKNEKGDPRPRFRNWNRSRQYFIKRYCHYPWYGRLLTSMSWSLYTTMLCAVYSIKR